MPDAVIARDAEGSLRRIRKRFIPEGVPVTMIVERDRPHKAILGLADKEKIPLIVLTTHGRTGLDRFLMGSTAEQVVRHARCPVWVVRAAPRSAKNRDKRRGSNLLTRGN